MVFVRLLNLHTHHPTGNEDLLEIENLYYPQLPSIKSGAFSAGLHPWFLKDLDWQAAERWLKNSIQSAGCLAVGEAGLDKFCSTPWDLQIRAFRLCIGMALDHGKPLIIHCVRAFSEVQMELRRCGLCGIFHGFDKNPRVAAGLLKSDCYLSFGAALLRSSSQAAASLQAAPADRFLLETDDRLIPIASVYERAAELRQISLAQLADQVLANARKAGLEI